MDFTSSIPPVLKRLVNSKRIISYSQSFVTKHCLIVIHEYNTHLSIRGPNIAGPRRAIHGATADMTRDSPLSRPTESMCSGRNGNIQPIP